jgi:hypothetical protein
MAQRESEYTYTAPTLARDGTRPDGPGPKTLMTPQPLSFCFPFMPVAQLCSSGAPTGRVFPSMASPPELSKKLPKRSPASVFEAAVRVTGP